MHAFHRSGKEIVVNGETVIVEARVVDGIIAERNVGNGRVIKTVGEPGILECLLADVRVGIKGFGDARGQGVDLDAGDLAAPVHFFGHQSDEMAYAARRFEHSPLFEAKPLQGGVHGPDDCG